MSCRNQVASYLNYLITDCYEEDYDPMYSEDWHDNFYFHFSFSEWYFIYRKRFQLNKTKKNHYLQTPAKLIIGADNKNRTVKKIEILKSLII
jgi:hypothetical protein